MMSRDQLVATMFVVVFMVSGCGKAKSTKLDQAKQLLHNKRHAQTLGLCNELLSENPSNYEAMLLRGQVNESLGKTTEAMADFSKAIEIAPKKPDGYAFRYKLSIEFAARESDPERIQVFEQAAIDDHRNYLRYSPSAAVAGLNISTPVPKSLAKPIPGFEPTFDYKHEVDDHLAAHNPPAALPADDVAGQADGISGEAQDQKRIPTRTATDKWLVERAESLRKIRQLDLKDSDELSEPTLPPHLDPTLHELVPPEIPAPLITRFDLPLSDGLRMSTPRKRRPGTTGIIQISDNEPTVTRDLTPLQNRSGSLISPLLSPPSQVRTTGIISGRQEQDSSSQARGSRNRRTGFGEITNLWVPWSPESPRVGANNTQPSGDDRKPRAKSAQILSMAIPNTSGSPAGQSQSPIGSKLVPAPWEEGYSPFRPRPTGIVTPSF